MKIKGLIFLVFALIYSVNLSAQILKGSSTLFFEQKAHMDAFSPNLPYGAELAFVLEDSTLYRWSRDLSEWAAYPGTSSFSNRVFHRRLTFGTDYSLPVSVLDTSDVISIYAGAQNSTPTTITLPTLSDTTNDGKVIIMRLSAAEDGSIIRVTSPDSTDILVQGCQAASVSGPDTVFTSLAVQWMYVVSNGRYYRICQRPNINEITSIQDTSTIDAHQGDVFINSRADTLGFFTNNEGWVIYRGFRENLLTASPSSDTFSLDTIESINVLDFSTVAGSSLTVIQMDSSYNVGKYIFHLKNTNQQAVDFPPNFFLYDGNLADQGSAYWLPGDKYYDCYFDGTNFYCHTSCCDAEVYEPFVSTWNTTLPGTSGSDEITLPLVSGVSYNFIVDWGDSTYSHITNWADLEKTHTYTSSGSKNVTITGIIGGWLFNNGGDDDKITNISQWGDLALHSASGHFYGCSNLTVTATDAPTIVGGEITRLFRDCISITSLDLSSWDFSAVTTSTEAFFGMTSLTNINFGSANFSSNTVLNDWFRNSSSINSIDLSSVTFRSAGVNMTRTFDGCTALDSVYLPPIKPTALLETFENCAQLVYVNVENMDVSSVGSFNSMFEDCTSIAALDVSGWNVGSATDMRSIFWNCSSLTSLDVVNWNTANVADAIQMFRGTTSLTKLDLTNWNLSNCTSFDEMFYATGADSLLLSGWNVAKATGFLNFAAACPNLVYADVTNWNTPLVRSLNKTFYQSVNLNYVDFTGWENDSLRSFISVFEGCTGLDSVNIAPLNSGIFTSLSRAFYGCTSLLQIDDLASWGMSNVTTLEATFFNCTSLAAIDVSGWTTSSLTNCSSTFGNCSLIDTLGLDSWDITNVTTFFSFLSGVTLQTSNYDDILVAFELQAVQNNVDANFGNSIYTTGGAGDTARAALIADHTWTITDGGGT